MTQKFELKWDIVTLYGMQTIKWPYPPVAGVWGRWWPDLLAQKKPGPGGTGQGEAPRAVQTWRLPSSKAATFGDDYLIKAPVPYFVKFLPKFFDKKYILAIFTPQKHIPASSKETGIVPHTPCMCGFFLAQPRQEDMKRILRQAYKHFFVKPGGKFFQKKQWPGPR